MTLRRLASTDDFVDHHRAGTAAAKGRHRREKRGAVRVRAVLDFEIGHLSLEDGRDRVGDRLRSRVGVLAIGLEKICANWHSREAGFAVIGSPRFVGPRDGAVGVHDGDASALLIDGRPGHLAPHGASVRSPSKTAVARARLPYKRTGQYAGCAVRSVRTHLNRARETHRTLAE